jgi:hypothetical protein
MRAPCVNAYVNAYVKIHSVPAFMILTRKDMFSKDVPAFMILTCKDMFMTCLRTCL